MSALRGRSVMQRSRTAVNLMSSSRLDPLQHMGDHRLDSSPDTSVHGAGGSNPDQVETIGKLNQALQSVHDLTARLEEEQAHRRAMEQQLQLSEAQNLAQRRRFLVSGTLLITGFLGFLISVPGLIITTISGINTGARGYILSLNMVSASMVLMAIMPTDTRIIRAAGGLICIFCIWWTCLELTTALIGFTTNLCVHDLTSTCQTANLICAVDAVLIGAISIGSWRVLSRRPGTPRGSLNELWRWSRTQLGPHLGVAAFMSVGPLMWVLKQNESTFRYSPREALALTWILARLYFLGISIALTGILLVHQFVFSEEGETWEHVLIGYGECIPIGLFFAWFWTSRNRGRVHNFLVRISMMAEVDAAAGIAAMIGSVSSGEAMAMAQRRLRAIPFSTLRAEHLTASYSDDLFRSTVKATLGRIDAFVSHSWRDDAALKWEQLSTWAAEFEKTNGRTPLLWFDKACIEQTDIATNLVCLPVFLASCKQLLVLAGPTYCERLWCVMEVFTFLKMGGSLSRINLLPIARAAQDRDSLPWNQNTVRSQRVSKSDQNTVMAQNASNPGISGQTSVRGPPETEADVVVEASSYDIEPAQSDSAKPLRVEDAELSGSLRQEISRESKGDTTALVKERKEPGRPSARAGPTADVEPEAIADFTLDDLRKRFEEFDASKAKCFIEAEKQQLLAVVETGFGSIECFNSLVSGILEAKERRTSLPGPLEQYDTTRRRSISRRSGSNNNSGGYRSRTGSMPAMYARASWGSKRSLVSVSPT